MIPTFGSAVVGSNAAVYAFIEAFHFRNKIQILPQPPRFSDRLVQAQTLIEGKAGACSFFFELLRSCFPAFQVLGRLNTASIGEYV